MSRDLGTDSAKPFKATVSQWPAHAQAFWCDLAQRLVHTHDIGEAEAELMAFTKIAMGIERPPEPPRTACGHDDTVTVIHVDTYGALCGACWRRWVSGGMDWPTAEASNQTQTIHEPAGAARHSQGA